MSVRGLIALVVCLLVAPLAAQQQMPDTKLISGIPLPAADVPAGALSVRLVIGNFVSDIADHAITFTVDGKTRVLKTDASGHVQLTGLKAGTHVKAVTTVNGEHLESQDITVATTGIRVVLAATDPEAAKRAEEDRKLAEGPAVKGTVVFGPETRVIAQMSDDQLNLFYAIDILNTARTPVDIGGPVLIDLPREARGASLLDGSSKQATVSGSHLTVLGPFAPGTTSLTVGFELPFSGGTASINQVWPVTLPQVTLMVQQMEGVEIRSPQIATKKLVSDQGATVIMAIGPAIQAGHALELDITGLPHHPIWPRNLALTLAGAIMAMGIWAAVFVAPRRRPS